MWEVSTTLVWPLTLCKITPSDRFLYRRGRIVVMSYLTYRYTNVCLRAAAGHHRATFLIPLTKIMSSNSTSVVTFIFYYIIVFLSFRKWGKGPKLMIHFTIQDFVDSILQVMLQLTVIWWWEIRWKHLVLLCRGDHRKVSEKQRYFRWVFWWSRLSVMVLSMGSSPQTIVGSCWSAVSLLQSPTTSRPSSGVRLCCCLCQRLWELQYESSAVCWLKPLCLHSRCTAPFSLLLCLSLYLPPQLCLVAQFFSWTWERSSAFWTKPQMCFCHLKWEHCWSWGRSCRNLSSLQLQNCPKTRTPSLV